MWNKRPSELIDLPPDHPSALDLDMALMIRLMDEERKMHEEAREGTMETREKAEAVTYSGADLFMRLFQNDRNTM